MASTVVGLFDNRSEAESVVRDLNDAGFRKDDISYVTQDRSKTAGATTRDDDDSMAAEGAGAGATAGTVLGGLGGLLVGTGALLIPGVGPALVAGSLAGVLGVTAAGAGIGAAAGGLVGGLVGLGVPEEHANYYAEGVRRGGTLVTVHAEDNKVSQAAQIMRRHGAVDIDKRAETYKSEGFNRFDEKSQPYAEHEATAHRDKYAEHRDRVDTGDKAVLEEVEEDIKVGKRQVQRGGVRVFSRVTETPVEKDVTLRDEEVHVSRRNVEPPGHRTPTSRRARSR